MTRASYRQLRLAPTPPEVPTEHYVSLPMPMPGGAGAWATFAAPCSRRPSAPTEVSPPQRWWWRDAVTGAVSMHMVATEPFTHDPITEALVLPTPTRDLAAALEDLTVLDESMDLIAEPYFADETAARVLRFDAEQHLRAVVPAPMVAWYERLSPGFFAWLRS